MGGPHSPRQHLHHPPTNHPHTYTCVYCLSAEKKGPQLLRKFYWSIYGDQESGFVSGGLYPAPVVLFTEKFWIQGPVGTFLNVYLFILSKLLCI